MWIYRKPGQKFTSIHVCACDAYKTSHFNAYQFASEYGQSSLHAECSSYNLWQNHYHNEHTKCSLKRYPKHSLQMDRLVKFCICVGVSKHCYFFLLLEVDWLFGLLRWCISLHGRHFALMLWELHVTPPQGTRWFSVAGRFHFMQVFEVKLKNIGTVKFFLWRHDSVLSRFHLRQVLLCFYLSCIWGWHGYRSSGWTCAGWLGS